MKCNIHTQREDIDCLKRIKLFRYLEFCVDEIRQLLKMEEKEVKRTLQDKAESFAEKERTCSEKQEICVALAKEYNINPKLIDEYNETIRFLESEELAEMKEGLKILIHPNLSLTIVRSLVFLGPVIWLFIHINEKMYDGLMLNAAMALLGTALITADWMHYIRHYRQHNAQVKKNNWEWAWTIPVLIVACIAGIAAILGVISLAERLMAPENYFFFEHHPIAGIAMIWLIMIPVILICVLLVAKLRKKSPEQMENMNDILYLWNHLGKWRAGVVVLWLVALYCCITSVTFVGEKEIVYYSPVHPEGIVYSYSDVEEINTGFGNKIFSVADYKKKGSFFYKIRLDGKTIVFSVPNVNKNIERYMEDSYLELEEFDTALVHLGIKKQGDDTGYENCDLDKQYVDRFRRIIANK